MPLLNSLARRPLAAAISTLCALAGIAAAADSKTSLTIYSSAQPGAIDPDLYRPVPGQQNYQSYGRGVPVPGYAVVRSQRRMDLKETRQTVKFDDVAAYIDPTTVSFTSLTDAAGTNVLEQNYQFDLVSTEKLLTRYLDHNISATVIRGDKAEQTSGTLLSSGNGQLILQQSNGQLQVVNGYVSLGLPTLPEGLLSKPTLIWDVETAQPGPHDVRVSYQTEGITWWADYNLTFTEGKDANSGTLDVGAWVSILNQSGATYPQAQLKLIAGDVHRAPRPQAYDGRMERLADSRGGPQSDGFAEKSFFEYHLYTLGRETTIPDNSTKQIELFPAARNVPCEKILVYDALGGNNWWDPYNPMMDQSYGVESRKDVAVYLRLMNSKDQGMGMPLPAGRIRVSKVDSADGSMEFIGEDVIQHTPRDEQVLIKLGDAFDVVGSRTQADFRLDTSRKTIDETIEIKVRNRKEEAVKVVIQERMFRWATWEITKSTIEPKKLDARLVQFPMTLQPGEEGTLRYTVHYSW